MGSGRLRLASAHERPSSCVLCSLMHRSRGGVEAVDAASGEKREDHVMKVV